LEGRRGGDGKGVEGTNNWFKNSCRETSRIWPRPQRGRKRRRIGVQRALCKDRVRGVFGIKSSLFNSWEESIQWKKKRYLKRGRERSPGKGGGLTNGGGRRGEGVISDGERRVETLDLTSIERENLRKEDPTENTQNKPKRSGKDYKHPGKCRQNLIQNDPRFKETRRIKEKKVRPKKEMIFWERGGVP